jgi:hypothetical protein
MAITTKDLGNGQWLINTGTSAYVTDQDQLAEATRQTESEVERQHQRVSDWNADETCIQTHIDQITAGTLQPEPGTNPQQYLCECPAGNFFVATKPQLEQRVNTQKANQDYITNTEIPKLEAELADMNDALEQIQSEPTDAQTITIAAQGLPVEIAHDPDPATLIDFKVDGDAEVKYIKLRTLIDHPAAPQEKLKIGLYKDNEHRELFYGDMQMDDQKTFESAYFNGMFAGGNWSVHLLNDHTASKNMLKECELTIYY